MPSKLGVHIVQGARNGYGHIYLKGAHEAGAPVPLVKSIDDYAPLEEAKATDPKTVTIFRTFREKDTPEGNFTGDPVAVAQAWMQRQMQHWQPGRADYFEPINEPDPATLEGYRWLNDFSMECMRIAEPAGFKLCLYNFAAGVPEVHEFRELLPSLRRARDHGHVLGLHEYGLGETGSMRDSAGGTTLRYRLFYDEVLKPAGLSDLKIFITEAAPRGGHHFEPGTFLDDVLWYDSEVRQDPYVIGVALFTLGDWAHSIHGSNFQDALPAITDHFRQVALAPDPRFEDIKPEQPPSEPPVVVVEGRPAEDEPAGEPGGEGETEGVPAGELFTPGGTVPLPGGIGPERFQAAPPWLLVIAGPSGVGKDTVTRELLRRNPTIHRAKTYTTRPPRPGEAEAGQYVFISREEFEARFASGEIMERTEVYGTGHLYGMPANLLSAAPPGKRFVLVEVDVNGKDFLVERFPGRCINIFITAPPDVLRQRIISRAHGEDPDPHDLEARLAKAREHMRRAVSFDYLIINDEGRLTETVTEIEAILMAERLRIRPGLDLERAFFTEA